MSMIKKYDNPRAKRHARIRVQLKGTATKPRLSIFRSNKSVICQLINDVDGRVLAAVYGPHQKNLSGTKTERATSVATQLAEKALAQNISQIVFDRGGYAYHGRVKAVAEELRQKGLKF
jgi:large subunit ribosomal protein L18